MIETYLPNCKPVASVEKPTLTTCLFCSSLGKWLTLSSSPTYKGKGVEREREKKKKRFYY